MKKAFLATALVFAMSVALAAQTTPTTTTTSQTPAPTSLTGCLSGGQNGMYTLRALDSGQVYTLRSANPLAAHAGHAVTVTGSMDTSASVNTTTTSSGPAPTTPATGAAPTPSTGAATTPTTGAAGTTAGTSNPAGMNPPTAGTTSGAPASGGGSSVFNVTSISMANESCEAGSAALGTGTPTSSTTGVTATGQSTTASSAGPAGSTASTGARSVTGQNQPSTTTQAGASTNTAGAQGETLSGCLLASNRDQGRFFLRTTKGKKFITEVIPSGEIATNFSEHVGHQVRLNGQFTDATAGNTDSTLTAQANTLPQSDQPERGKKAHERDRNTGRQFTATNLEMISSSGCPQSSTTPNNDRSKRMKGTEPDNDKDLQKK